MLSRVNDCKLDMNNKPQLLTVIIRGNILDVDLITFLKDKQTLLVRVKDGGTTPACIRRPGVPPDR